MSWTAATSSIRPPIASALAAARQHHHRHHHCPITSGVVECLTLSSTDLLASTLLFLRSVTVMAVCACRCRLLGVTMATSTIQVNLSLDHTRFIGRYGGQLILELCTYTSFENYLGLHLGGAHTRLTLPYLPSSL